jgi:hypothetical protein
MPRWTRACAALILTTGALLRLRQFVAGRPLWLDEASFALNVVSRSYRALAGHLDFEVVAPLPFLWATRLVVDLFGPGERALRTIPLLAGLLLPLVIWLIGKRSLGTAWGLLPAAISAITPALIYYSNEAKPYAVDVVAAGLLIWLTLRLIEDSSSVPRWTALVITGCVALVTSFPAVLVLPGVCLALLRDADVRRAGAPQRSFILSLALWAVAFVLSYGAALHAGGNSPYLRRHWAHAFLDPRDDGALSRWRLVAEALEQDLLGAPDPMHRESALAAAVLILGGLGVAWLWRNARRADAILLGVPLAAAIGASALRLYPLVARTVLFCIPLLLVLLCAGIRAVQDALPRSRVIVGATGAFVLLAPGAGISLSRAVSPNQREDIRSLLDDLKSGRAQGEPLYVYVRSIEPWTYYETDWHRPEAGPFELVRRVAGHDGEACFENGRRDAVTAREGDDFVWHGADGPVLLGLASGASVSAVSGGGRPPEPVPGWAGNEARRIREAAHPIAWLLFTHALKDEESRLLDAVERSGGSRIGQLTSEGAIAYAYRFP